jgi:hypothetical protein
MKTKSRSLNAKTWLVTAVSFVLLLLAGTASAQWTTENATNNIYYNSGNVGIGATTPGFLLDAQSNSSSNATIAISSTLGSPPANVGFLAAVDSSNRGRYDFFWNGGAGGLAIRNGSNSAGNILFLTNNSGTNGLGHETEKARIDKSGNLGLGTTSPGFLFDAQTNSSSNATIAISSTLGSPPANVGFLAAVDSSNRGRYDFFWNGGSGGLAIRNGSNSAGNILFFTNSSGTNGPGNETEKVRIDKAGNVGIGTTSPGRMLDIKGVAGVTELDINLNRGGNGDNAAAILQTAGTNDWILGERGGLSNSDFHLYSFGSSADAMTVLRSSGNVGIGNPNPAEKLDVAGNVKVAGNITLSGTINAHYQDVAEWVRSSEQIATGTVVVLDATKSNQVVRSTQAYDTRVAGVISERPGLAMGESGEGKVLVATTGRVLVKVDASNGPIHIGDLLVTSDVPGVAMKSEPVNLGGIQLHRPGTIIGKALQPLEKGSGGILVLLSLQ